MDGDGTTDEKPKTLGVTRLFWGFTGCCGGDRFYLSHTLWGLGNFALFAFGVTFIVVWATALDAATNASITLLVFGIVFLGIWLILWAWQGWRLPKDVAEYNRRRHLDSSAEEEATGDTEAPLLSSATPPAGGLPEVVGSTTEKPAGAAVRRMAVAGSSVSGFPVGSYGLSGFPATGLAWKEL
jgi:hypothetical protein